MATGHVWKAAFPRPHGAASCASPVPRQGEDRGRDDGKTTDADKVGGEAVGEK